MNTELIESIKGICDNSELEWHEWCDLETKRITGTEHPGLQEQRTRTHNTQACECAVIAWAGEVARWWSLKNPHDNVAVAMPDIDGDWSSEVCCDDKCVLNEASNPNTQYAACVALIHAVAKELGETK